MSDDRQLLTKQEMPEFKQAARSMADRYGKDNVKAAIAECSGRSVYIYRDANGEISGFEAIDRGTGEVVASIGTPDPQTRPAAAPRPGGYVPAWDDPRTKTSPDGARSATKAKSRIALKVVAAIVALAVIAAGALFACNAISTVRDASSNSAAVDDDEPDYASYEQAPPDAVVHIQVIPGDNIISVRQKMLDAGLVSIAREFAPAMRANGGTDALKATDYVVAASEGAASVASRMASGTRVPKGVIGVNPGDDIYDIARAIDEASLPFSGGDFLLEAQKVSAYKQDYPMLFAVPDSTPSLEGYFPEGEYNLGASKTVSDGVRVMLKQAQSNFDASGMDSFSYFAVLTKASLIEKEALFDEDRPLISSVIDNRLVRGWPLQIDASVKYATNSDEARVTFSQLEVESPYNTYKVVGLPAGPICSGISKASFDAAVSPAKTDFLYYVLKDKEGHHAFSSTSEQFEQDRNRYLELFGYSD